MVRVNPHRIGAPKNAIQFFKHHNNGKTVFLIVYPVFLSFLEMSAQEIFRLLFVMLDVHLYLVFVYFHHDFSLERIRSIRQHRLVGLFPNMRQVYCCVLVSFKISERCFVYRTPRKVVKLYLLKRRFLSLSACLYAPFNKSFSGCDIS